MKASDLRASLLSEAVSGRLVPQFADEGTAAELLKEIEAEKKALFAAGKIKKEKPLPEITEEEIPFEIPESWEWVRIGKILNLHAGKSKDKSEIHDSYYSGSYPCYGGNGLRGYVSDYNQEGFHCLIGRQGALCGNINYADGKFYATEHAVVVDTYCNCHTQLIGLFLQALNLNQYATAVAQPGLAVRDINTKLFPLPPLAEQRRIVAKLDELMPLVDAYEKEEQQLSALEKAFPENLRKSILQEAVSGKLVPQIAEEGTAAELLREIEAEKKALVAAGKIKKEKPLPEITEEEIPFEIPESWEWVRLGKIVNIRSAQRVHQSDWRKKGVPFYRAREIVKLSKEGKVDNELFIETTLYEKLKQISGVPVAGDLMVSGVGTLGATYVVKSNDRFYYKDASVLCFENIHKLNSKFLKLMMESPLMSAQINSSEAMGTTVATLTMERANAFLVALPPLAEQRRIVAKVEELMKLVDKL